KNKRPGTAPGLLFSLKAIVDARIEYYMVSTQNNILLSSFLFYFALILLNPMLPAKVAQHGNGN
ncbi:MAG: hypothetical protein R6U85_12970, partial [Salinivirgaceae bacterium]